MCTRHAAKVIEQLNSRPSGVVKARDACVILRQCLKATVGCHSKGFVHRDLKLDIRDGTDPPFSNPPFKNWVFQGLTAHSLRSLNFHRKHKDLRTFFRSLLDDVLSALAVGITSIKRVEVMTYHFGCSYGEHKVGRNTFGQKTSFACVSAQQGFG
eukprot:2955861-Amphidinium_carterae.1